MVMLLPSANRSARSFLLGRKKAWTSFRALEGREWAAGERVRLTAVPTVTANLKLVGHEKERWHQQSSQQTASGRLVMHMRKKWSSGYNEIHNYQGLSPERKNHETVRRKHEENVVTINLATTSCTEQKFRQWKKN